MMSGALDRWLKRLQEGVGVSRLQSSPQSASQESASSAAELPGYSASVSTESPTTRLLSAESASQRAASQQQQQQQQKQQLQQQQQQQQRQFLGAWMRRPYTSYPNHSGEPAREATVTTPSPTTSFWHNNPANLPILTPLQPSATTASLPRQPEPQPLTTQQQGNSSHPIDQPATPSNGNGNSNETTAPTDDGDMNMSEDELNGPVLPIVVSDLNTPSGGQGGPLQHTREENGSTSPPVTPGRQYKHGPSLRGGGGGSRSNGIKVEIPMTPVVSIPAMKRERDLSPASTSRLRKSSISISIPAMSTPRTRRSTAAAARTPSSVVAVGRRSRTINGVTVPGGRPKGWKPGMSYRDVRLRNLGLDENDPSVAILLPPAKQKRKPGDPYQRVPRRHRAEILSGGQAGGQTEDRGRGGNEKRQKQAPKYVFKRTGRPPVLPLEVIQRKIFLESKAEFHPFVCRWAGCRAELHNMATMRRHVMVVHGRERTCRWRRCAEKTSPVEFRDVCSEAKEKSSQCGHDKVDQANQGGTGDMDGTDGMDADAMEEDEKETFEEHMEYHHLVPMSWHQGDGFANSGHIGPPEAGFRLIPQSTPLPVPTNGEDASCGRVGSDAKAGKESKESKEGPPLLSAAAAAAKNLPRYLLDSEGRQVTPLVQDAILGNAALSRTPEETMQRLEDAYRQMQRRR